MGEDSGNMWWGACGPRAPSGEDRKDETTTEIVGCNLGVATQGARDGPSFNPTTTLGWLSDANSQSMPATGERFATWRRLCTLRPPCRPFSFRAASRLAMPEISPTTIIRHVCVLRGSAWNVMTCCRHGSAAPSQCAASHLSLDICFVNPPDGCVLCKAVLEETRAVHTHTHTHE